MSCDFSDLPKSILLDIFRPVFRFWLECQSKNFNKCSILDRYSDAIWNPKFSSKQQLFTVWILDPSMRQTETSSWKRVFNVLDCTIKHSLLFLEESNYFSKNAKESLQNKHCHCHKVLKYLFLILLLCN